MNISAIDINTSGTRAIDNVTIYSLLFSVIIGVIFSDNLSTIFFIDGIVLITDIGTRIRLSVRQSIQTITPTKQFVDFIGAIYRYRCSGCRGCITTTIDSLNTSAVTTVNDD